MRKTGHFYYALTNATYELDGVGNRGEVEGGENPGEYEMSDATPPPPQDRPVNQYTTAPHPGPSGSVSTSREYDENGNLLAIDGGTAIDASMGYDYRNRMVVYIDAEANGGVGVSHRNFAALPRHRKLCCCPSKCYPWYHPREQP